MQLEIKRQALKKEKDPASVERREIIERELAELKERSAAMKAQWQQEKETLGAVGKIKQQIEREMKEAESKLASHDGRPQFLKEEVGAEDIAEVVARWTGIPVTRMMEGERERLTKLDQELARRVVGPVSY